MSLLARIDREEVRRGGLSRFVSLAWQHVGGIGAFVPNWHIDLVCAHLEAVTRGEISDLVINIPPGSAKSLLTAVFWPAWEWIDHPHHSLLTGSYDIGLVRRDASRTIDLLRSPWFTSRWGERLPGNAKLAASDFRNSLGTHRLGTTPKGRATGHHFRAHAIDDPIKPRDAAGGAMQSTAALDEVRLWYHETLSTRFASQVDRRRVLTMQRLHEADLAGEVIAEGEATAVVLPMRFDPARRCETPWGRDPRTEPGELLFPARFPEAATRKLEVDLGQYGTASQLQQQPTPRGGSILKRELFRRWTSLPDKGAWVLSIDATFKDLAASDYVAMQIWLAAKGNYYLAERWRLRLDLPATVSLVRSILATWPQVYHTIIEDKANGPAIEQTLRHEFPGLVAVPTMGGKLARANATAPILEAGRIYIPDGRPWVDEYLGELSRFPAAKNDDEVDSTTQAILYLDRFGAGFAAAMAGFRRG